MDRFSVSCTSPERHVKRRTFLPCHRGWPSRLAFAACLRGLPSCFAMRPVLRGELFLHTERLIPRKMSPFRFAIRTYCTLTHLLTESIASLRYHTLHWNAKCLSFPCPHILHLLSHRGPQPTLLRLSTHHLSVRRTTLDTRTSVRHGILALSSLKDLGEAQSRVCLVLYRRHSSFFDHGALSQWLVDNDALSKSPLSLLTPWIRRTNRLD